MSSKQRSIRRRKFVAAGMATVAGSAVGCGRPRSPWRFFTAQEAFTLEAVCQRLIPADQDPGAREAGVVNYIDLQLTRHYRRFQDAYRRGLAALSERRFAELSEEKQIAALTELERSDRAFFDLVLAHAMQGFYGDPRHGGNRDWVSWRILGVVPSPVRGRRHYDLSRQGQG